MMEPNCSTCLVLYMGSEYLLSVLSLLDMFICVVSPLNCLFQMQVS